ncbi:ligand-binding sensor domain-containing diguanylate cyclase [Congregibacter litoralis]|uniref:ligand-binding sensor domain-containing diguanylate cyclase n=1 Tax=Congregibacter litoralis TaxID=393662 RepID=UPI00006B1A3C|nr:diguanylate cyclase [Congregibacter litoralis]
MIRRLAAIISGSLLLGALTAQALDPDRLPSQYLIDRYGRDSGLPSDRVWVSEEGPRGYLWIGTQGGLARFDGADFKTFNQQTHEAFNASDIRALEWTPDGDLWIGTYGGGAVFMRGREFESFSKDQGLISNVIYDIHRAVDGSIWFATDLGLTQRTGGEFRSWTVADGLASNRIFDIAEDSEGNLWFSSLTNGVSYFDGSTFHRIGTEDGLDSLQVHMLRWDKELGVIAGTDSGAIYQLSTAAPPALLPSATPKAIQSSLLDRDGNRWLGSYGDGVWRLSADGRETHFPLDSGHSSEHIFDLVEDARGSLWVATGHGLFRVKDSPFLALGSAEGLADSTFVVTAQSDDTVWIGTEPDGLFRVEADGSISQPFPELVDKSVSSLLVSADDSLWVGTFGDGLFHIREGAIEHFAIADGLLGDHVLALQQLRDGSIWIATNRGLNAWLGDDADITTPLPELSDTITRHILEARNGVVWLSSNSGLYGYDGGKLEHWTEERGLASNVVRTSYEDDRGVLWIATGAGTLSRLDKGRLFSYDRSHGLPLSAGYAILEDRARNLWISSTQGLLRVTRDSLDAVARGERNTLDTRVFEENDGLRSTQFTGGFQPAGWVTRDNRLWFTSTKGATTFSPQKLTTDSTPLRTYIDAIRVDGKPVAVAEPVAIPANFQSLEIDYSSPELSKAHSISFRYSTVSNGDFWTDAGNRRTAYFSALPAGETAFRVQASFDGELFPTTPDGLTSLTIYRTPHWYETTWSVLLGVALIALLVSLLQRYQSRSARQREQQLRQLVDLRTEELRDALVRVEANSRIDSLTGVANRRHLEEHLNATWSMSRRTGTPVSILMLDIDLFKQYNDSLGHAAGDDCLRTIAQAIKGKLLREHDMLARYGGEEFVVVLYDTDAAGAVRTANRILECVRALALQHPASQVSEHVTISIGCASMGDKERDDPHRLIDLADKALYEAKAKGRNRVHSTAEESADTALERG